jgi:5-methylcytosine-specific restriction endonuclease McrA
MALPDIHYPEGAYAIKYDGKLWWDRKKGDGPRGAEGAVPRTASWLKFNKQIGDLFTTVELRQALGVKDEHFQRRIRELKSWGWDFDGSKDSSDLKDEYRLIKYGWWPGSEERKPTNTSSISGPVRREVIERDGGRCVLCGVAAGEPYPDPPTATARITIGHLIPASAGGTNALDNLRAECARCNETAHADTRTPETANSLIQSIRSLSPKDRARLRSWVAAGSRQRDNVDRIYDRYRLAPPQAQSGAAEWLNNRA